MEEMWSSGNGPAGAQDPEVAVELCQMFPRLALLDGQRVGQLRGRPEGTSK